MSILTTDPIPTQRASGSGTSERTTRRPSTGGHSLPDCSTCMLVKAAFEDSYGTPAEGEGYYAWVSHMNAAHPDWRSGPASPRP